VIYIEFFPYCLFVSNSQVIGCEDSLRNDLYCVGWGVNLYSIQSNPLHYSASRGKNHICRCNFDPTSGCRSARSLAQSQALIVTMFDIVKYKAFCMFLHTGSLYKMFNFLTLFLRG